MSNTILDNMLSAKMRYLSQRQAVLSQNVANANTPGFVSKDVVKPSSFHSMAMGAGFNMARTNRAHFNGNGASDGSYAVQRNKYAELTLTGNGVNVEEEVFKMAKSKQEYNVAINIYKKMRTITRAAIGNIQ